MLKTWRLSGIQSVLTLGALVVTGGLGGCEFTPNAVTNPPEEAAVFTGPDETLNPPRASAAPPPQTEVATTPELPPGYSGDAIGSELERMLFRPCEQRLAQEIGGVSYSLCLGREVAGSAPVLSAASTLPGEDRGETYWFRDNGQLYAIHETFPGGPVRSVFVDDQQTLITTDVQGNFEVIRDRQQWENRNNKAFNAVAMIQERLTSAPVAAAQSFPVGTLLVAGQGGDFNHHTLTLTVPQSDTSSSVNGGALRWYDLHLATMVALTADQYCNHQSTRGVYFNYEAEGGDVFMGQYFISCSEARSIMETYGREQEVWVTLTRPEFDRDQISQSIPYFTDATAREFQRTVVENLTPDCIETGGMTICPGDRG